MQEIIAIFKQSYQTNNASEVMRRQRTDQELLTSTANKYET
jgi:hypothetical protein